MITIGIVIITCAISYFALNQPQLLNKLCHHPFLERNHGEYHRLISAGFVHGSFPHLAINMFVLFQFGQIVEDLFTQIYGTFIGNMIYVVFYLSAIVIANMGTFFKHADNSRFSSVGASGVTSAIVFIYAFLDPWQMFLWPPLPAIIMAILYIGYSTWASNKGRDNIDHLAHLYGALYGIFFILVAYPESLRIFLTRLMSFSGF